MVRKTKIEALKQALATRKTTASRRPVVSGSATTPQLFSATAYEQLLKKYPMNDLTDGVNQYESLERGSDGTFDPTRRAGAWLRVERKSEVKDSFLCCGKFATDFYPGNIFVVNESLMNGSAKYVQFRDGERKPLTLGGDNYLHDDDDPLKDIAPTEREVNKAIGKYAYMLAKQNSSTKPSIEIYSQDFETGVNLSLAGSIKDVDFSVTAADPKKRRRVFVLREKLYTVSLNNTYKNGGDFFTDKMNLKEFESQLGGCAPAIVQSVNYGRVIFITISSQDTSAFKAEIAGFKLDLGGGEKKCEIDIKIFGGTINGMAEGDTITGLESAEKVLNYYSNPANHLKANEAGSAIPIEFEATYLQDMGRKVKINILPFTTAYVDKVRVKLIDNNKGMSAKCRFGCLTVAPDSSGKVVYKRVAENKKLDYSVEVSPRSICLQVKVDATGSGRDSNVFCPRIPLEDLRPDTETGEWIFRFYLKGTTLYDQSFMFSPNVDGCYYSTDNDYYLSNDGILSDSKQYEDLVANEENERKCLIRYYSWCEWHYRNKSAVKRLTAAAYQNKDVLPKDTDRSLFYKSCDTRTTYNRE